MNCSRSKDPNYRQYQIEQQSCHSNLDSVIWSRANWIFLSTRAVRNKPPPFWLYRLGLYPRISFQVHQSQVLLNSSQNQAIMIAIQHPIALLRSVVIPQPRLPLFILNNYNETLDTNNFEITYSHAPDEVLLEVPKRPSLTLAIDSSCTRREGKALLLCTISRSLGFSATHAMELLQVSNILVPTTREETLEIEWKMRCCSWNWIICFVFAFSYVKDSIFSLVMLTHRSGLHLGVIGEILCGPITFVW